MNQQEKQEPNNLQSVTEDLTVDQDQAEEVKGGAQFDYFLRLHSVDGDVTS